MKHQCVVEAWGKEYERVYNEPVSESQKRLFVEIAGLMEAAYKEGAKAGMLKANAI